MIESHLVGGRQDAAPGQKLTYGQSITDACLAWPETVPSCASWPTPSARAAPADRRSRIRLIAG